MRLVAVGAGVAAVLAVALSGCSGQSHSQVPSPTSSPSPSRTSLDLGAYTPAPSGVVDEDTGQTITPKPVATWDAASRTGALEAAQTAMTAFARRDLDFDAWWAQLSPLLTQQAQQDYTYVDPANIPAGAVTGAGVIVDETSAYVALVQVPTDVGAYTLTLTRADGQSPWLASRFTPPDGVN